MRLITDWMAYSWELLQIRGWWFAVGLILCIIVTFLPLKAEKTQNRSFLFWCLVWGILLPVCNFAAVPLAAALLNRGVRIGAVFAFLSAAVLLNPSGILSAWAYMGTELATAWIISAVIVSLAVGTAGIWFLRPVQNTDRLAREKRGFSHIFSISVSELAFWLVLGTLAQALIQALAPQDLWQTLLLNPAGTSFADAAAGALVRHVCIPDDVALAASLAATGFPPGWAVLLLIVGISTNLPELFVLYGMAGKKPAVLYGLVSICSGIAAGLVTQLLIGPGFVPQFNLAGSEPLIRLSNSLSISTWMPAKIPGAAALLLLAGIAASKKIKCILARSNGTD